MTLVERLRRVNARQVPEESVTLRVCVLVAVMAAVTAVLRQSVGGPVLAVACLAGIPAAYVFSHRYRHHDGFALKVGLAVALGIAFVRFLAQVGTGASTGLAGAQVPLAELFLWVQVLHSLDVPARRDLLFSLAASVVLLAVAGVFSVSLALTPHLLVFAPAFVASLVLAHWHDLDQARPLAAARPPDRAAVRPTATALGLVALVGLALLFVLPAPGATRAVTFPARLADSVAVPRPGGLSNPALGESRSGDPDSAGAESHGYFGFAEELDLAVRGRPDDTLVMRVRAARPALWRGQTFDTWDGRRWTLSDDRVRPVRSFPGEAIDLPTVEEPIPAPPDRELVQTFYLRESGPNLVFAAHQPTRLYFPQRAVFQLSDGTIRSGVELGDGAVYTVVSQQPDVDAAALRAAGGAAPADLYQRYTEVPVVSERVQALAREVTAGSTNIYDVVLALEAWMGANLRYSLDVPPLPQGADAVDQFLFEDRVGFCEQIGTSLVVMLRSLGIPARLVIGYAPGERNPFTGLYEVRARDAHAWAEVWFPGVGWQGFDPTAEVPLAGEAGTTRAGSGLASWLTARLPDVPVVPVAVLGTMAAAVVIAVRRRPRHRPWATVYVDRLEAAGATRSRPRGPGETVTEYVHALGRSVLPDPRLAEVAALLDREAWSAEAVTDDERQRADAVLAEASARWPA